MAVKEEEEEQDYYYSLQMGFYPVAEVLQYTKKKHTHTHTLKTIHNTQNYKQNKVHALHTLQTQNGIIST
jgi:hypothetical protein